MKVLFIGGTGIISSACSQLAIENGIDLHLLNRGKSDRPVPDSATVLTADFHDSDSVRSALGSQRFDVVVDWIAYTPDRVEADLELFRSRTDQYVFISSASAYMTPPVSLPVTESTPLYNPFWEYSRNKIACEERLIRAYRDEGFPVTIVRPSHTYDRTSIPVQGGYTVIDRMRKGKKVVVHGDGATLWALTHHRDFAKGFVPLLGNNHAIGEVFHITTDELLTWNAIVELLAKAAGATADIVHIPSGIIARYDEWWGESLLGDKTHCMIFDNTKIKRAAPGFEATIPFARGAEEIIAWYDADPARRVVDQRVDEVIDRLVEKWEASWS
ncbi:MAG TPA: SDR family oxidoreductase [Rhodothermales bacterium]|nr:SDR family oxidoreductase [Rhodothermales bacterium]